MKKYLMNYKKRGYWRKKFLYKNEEMYGESIEFYDIAALPHSNVNESILKKFARMVCTLWVLHFARFDFGTLPVA